MEPAVRVNDPLAAEWVTALFIGCVIILAVINRGSPRAWRLLMQAAFRMRLGKQTLREEVDVRDRNFLGLLLVAVSVIAVFCWQVLHALHVAGGPSFGTLVGIVAGAMLVQGVVPAVVSSLARTDAGAGEYLYTGALLYAILGLVLLPLVILMAYQVGMRDVLVVVGAVLIAIALLYRWVRGAWIGMGEGAPIRYIFLYLCTAEILPVLLVIHALRQPLPPAPHL